MLLVLTVFLFFVFRVLQFSRWNAEFLWSKKFEYRLEQKTAQNLYVIAEENDYFDMVSIYILSEFFVNRYFKFEKKFTLGI